MNFSRFRSLPARVNPSTKTFAAANAESCAAVWRGAVLYFSCNARNSALPSPLTSDGTVGNARKILFLDSDCAEKSVPLSVPRKKRLGDQPAAAASFNNNDCSFPSTKKNRDSTLLFFSSFTIACASNLLGLRTSFLVIFSPAFFACSAAALPAALLSIVSL